VPLESSAARRHCAGSLQLASEPERIESGWWDEHDVARDYYTAIGPHGQRLWIYRDLANGVWHLHGIFG
jgi:protein ImuB